MKTWEMIKELTENPNKKFICDDIIAEVKRSSEIHIAHSVTGKDFGACINDEWEEVKESVDFMTAVSSGRRIKVIHPLVCDLGYTTIRKKLERLSVYFNDIDLKQIIANGEWYIED